MRWVLAVCLLAACAGSPRPPPAPQRVEVRADAWSLAYRLVLDDPAAPRLEGIATIANRTAEDWTAAKLTLSTASDGIDRDHDGIRDSADLCPSDPEDFDGNNDDDGCPERDNDADRILDETDKCPNEPETYNGTDDDDGCPDRGNIVITPHGGGIIEWIFFTPGSDVVKPVSFPIIDAVVATINGNPQLRVIEISGHTDRSEKDPWVLSLRRAAAVTQMLIDKGVAPERLTLGPYGATLPLAPGSSAADLAHNRRAGFALVKRDDDVVPALAPAVRPPFDPPPPELDDDLRYELAQPVTLKRSRSATLAIVDKPVTAREVQMWQPDPEVAGSNVLPFSAVHLVNTTGFVLQRGPVEIVRGGRVIGRAVLRRLGIGETAWIRGELGGALVTASAMAFEEPRRVVGGDRGSLVVENVVSQRMQYVIKGGSAQLEIHHRRLPNHTVEEMPSGTVELADRLIVTREVTAGALTSVVIDEQQPRRLNRQVQSIPPTELRIYLEGSKLPPDVGDRLRAVLTQLRASETHESMLARDRIKLSEIARRWQQTGRPLDRPTRAELDEIARSIGQTTELLARNKAQLDDLIAKLPTW